MEDIMSIDKKEDMRASSEDLMESTPEAEAEAGGPSHPDHQENPGQPKRKGGRKPIYATSEERKQRNRQAQAAFRERRTEYIKQLEESIRVHETNLHSLQTAHRSAADECLMLRYKNSLLERILLEKGIDVQAELRAKTGSPHLGPTHIGQNMGQTPTVQRAIMNRHHQARRSNSNIAPKLEPGTAPHPHPHPTMNPTMNPNQSPQTRPTPPSHHSSPSSLSPGFTTQGVMTPPATESQIQMQRAQQQMKSQIQHAPSAAVGLGPPLASAMKAPGSSGPGSMGSVPAAYYPSPFQNHIEQLEQEYESQADMVDDQDTNETSGPGPYPASFHPMPPNPSPHPGAHQQHISSAGDNAGTFSQLLDPFDPMLDLDPFGLSASMHFPTQFTFDTSSMR